MRTRVAVVVTSIALAFVGACDKKSGSDAAAKTPRNATPTTASKLGDLSSSLAAVREEFNAHKGEARFMALLSPT